MKTKKVSLEKIRLYSGGCIISSYPMTVQRDNDDLCLVLEEDREGDAWKESDFLIHLIPVLSDEFYTWEAMSFPALRPCSHALFRLKPPHGPS